MEKAVSRKDWTPSIRSHLCSVHFPPDSFDRSSLCYVRLKENTVPSIFEAFPSYMRKEKKSRKCPKDRPIPNLEIQKVTAGPCMSSTSLLDEDCKETVSVQLNSPTKLQLKRRLEALDVLNDKNRKKIKILHQSKRHLKTKIKSLAEVIESIREKKLMQEDSLEILSSVADCNEEFLYRHECICALYANQPATMSLIHFKSRGGLVYPSTSLYRLCKMCEAVFRRNPECNSASAKNCFNLLHKEKDVLEKVVDMELFSDLNNHAFNASPMDNHILQLIRAVIKQYFIIRYKYECKRLTNNPLAIRQLYTKLVLFKGQ